MTLTVTSPPLCRLSHIFHRCNYLHIPFTCPTAPLLDTFWPHRRSTPAAVFKWAPTLAMWGGAGAGAVMLFMSGVPLFKKDVLLKLPVVRFTALPFLHIVQE